MARRVYFAFHYQRDIWRVNEVRNSWVTQEREEAGFYDASLWEESKKKGDLAIKRMINAGIQNTSVTCVLIGTETFKRRWVQYEIVKSFDKGNGLLGVYIDSLADKDRNTCPRGKNPFDYLGIVLADDGKSAEVKVWDNGSWVNYTDYPKVTCNYKAGYGGNFYQFSKLGAKLYDWSEDDGYTNFDTWVEDAIG